LYPGTEIWDFSLVAPDNRRPVDYGLRQAMMAEVAQVSYATLLESWREGGIKLRVIRDLLRFRRANPPLFSSGSYRAVEAAGSFAGNVVAFMREHAEAALLVIVPRVTAKIGCPAVGSVWDDTRLAEDAGAAGWKDVLTGREFPAGEPLLLRSLLAELPFAVLQSSIVPQP